MKPEIHLLYEQKGKNEIYSTKKNGKMYQLVYSTQKQECQKTNTFKGLLVDSQEQHVM